ncbi:hypothetical protein ONZ51_g12128 [Trametes cubensis]|uniref:Uncharacterized protein n=1 Tax=Trametes cubensis TaxID=1111947 RepID=A0AAD7TG90_9APHY|nr:hypothetical protein ONZ51_g12128 [Trametes cubensis]
MNPCTLGWYLPLLVKDLPGALQPSDGERATESPAAVGPAPHEPGQASRRSQGAEQVPHQQVPTSDASSAPHGRSSSSTGSAVTFQGEGTPTDTALEPNLALDRPRERTRQDLAWRELDAKFRRDLPDDAYVGRLAYRGLVMRACPHIRMLDGIEVERKERDKAERLLRSIFGGGNSDAHPAATGPGTRATEGAAASVEQS